MRDNLQVFGEWSACSCHSPPFQGAPSRRAAAQAPTRHSKQSKFRNPTKATATKSIFFWQKIVFVGQKSFVAWLNWGKLADQKTCSGEGAGWGHGQYRHHSGTSIEQWKHLQGNSNEYVQAQNILCVARTVNWNSLQLTIFTFDSFQNCFLLLRILDTLLRAYDRRSTPTNGLGQSFCTVWFIEKV